MAIVAPLGTAVVPLVDELKGPATKNSLMMFEFAEDPVKPVGPVAPVGPVKPVKPVGPVAPVGPVSPVGPVYPV